MLRVFTSFSGYDSQCMALDRLPIDYELVGWSEIDKYAIQAHNAVYPQWADRNFGDISKIDWAQVPDFDLFTYSSPCQDFSQAGLQRGGGICNTLTGVQKDNLLTEPRCEVVGKLEGGKWDKSLDIMKRVYGENGIAPTQHCVGGGNMECKVQTNFRIRKLTERECFRLMDVSESDIDKIQAAKISRTQQYKMAGNSIVVACLEGIFRRMFVDTEPTELKLFY